MKRFLATVFAALLIWQPALAQNLQPPAFVQDGIGAVPRILIDKLKQDIEVNVRDFGGALTCVAYLQDDAPAIQRAVNYVKGLGGGKVKFPKHARCRINSTVALTITATGISGNYVPVIFEGEGNDSIVNNYGTGAAFRVDSNTGSEYIIGVEFRRFAIKGTGNASSGIGLTTTRAANMVIDGMLFDGNVGGALYMEEAQSSTIRGMTYFVSNGGASTACVDIRSATTINVLDSRFTNNACGVAISIHDTYGTIIRDNRIESSGDSVRLCRAAASGGTLNSTTIEGNAFEFPVNKHIVIGNTANNCTATNVKIANNHFSMSNRANARGVYIERGRNLKIEDNLFTTNGLGFDLEFAAGGTVEVQLGRNRESSGGTWLTNSFAADPWKRPGYIGTSANTLLGLPSWVGPQSISSPAYAAAITPDCDSALIYNVGTLTGNITINAPLNPGGRITFIFTQDGTGGRTVSWNPVFIHNWSNTGNAASTRSTISFVYNGTNWVQDGAQFGWL